MTRALEQASLPAAFQDALAGMHSGQLPYQQSQSGDPVA